MCKYEHRYYYFVVNSVLTFSFISLMRCWCTAVAGPVDLVDQVTGRLKLCWFTTQISVLLKSSLKDWTLACEYTMMTFLNSKDIAFLLFCPAKNSSSIVERKKKKGNFSKDTSYYWFLLYVIIGVHTLYCGQCPIWLQDQTKNKVDGRYYVIQHLPAQHPLETCYDSLVVMPL